MSTFNYAEIVDLAEEMMLEFGREVTVIKADRAADNSAKPWLGPTAAKPTLDVTTGRQSVKVNATFVNPFDVQQFADVVIESPPYAFRAEKVALVAAADAPLHDLREFNSVEDGTDIWKIFRVHRVKPGDTVVLYALELDQ